MSDLPPATLSEATTSSLQLPSSSSSSLASESPPQPPSSIASSRPSLASVAAAKAIRSKQQQALKQTIIYVIIGVLACTALLVAFFFPNLRESVLLVTVGLILLWLRYRYFSLPGINQVPSANLRRLLSLRASSRADRQKVE